MISEEGKWMLTTNIDTNFMLVPGGYLVGVGVTFNGVSLVFVPGHPPAAWLKKNNNNKEKK